MFDALTWGRQDEYRSAKLSSTHQPPEACGSFCHTLRDLPPSFKRGRPKKKPSSELVRRPRAIRFNQSRNLSNCILRDGPCIVEQSNTLIRLHIHNNIQILLLWLQPRAAQRELNSVLACIVGWLCRVLIIFPGTQSPAHDTSVSGSRPLKGGARVQGTLVGASKNLYDFLGRGDHAPTSCAH